MYKKIITLFAALLFVPQCLWATVHTVSHNVSTVVNLQDNDEINLVDFPAGWGFSRVVLGVNSVPATQLSGRLVTNGCDHELQGNYEQIDFAYTGNESIVYHGPAQSLPIQWWVDANPIVSSCKSYAEVLRKDSIRAAFYNLVDSVYSDAIKDYVNLGDLNSETIFEGSVGNFKIVNLPDWFYNRIIVQVESMDGRELNGGAYAKGAESELKGYSITFPLNQVNSFAPTFELAFPEFRKVKVKWWAEVGVPDETLIEAKETVLSSDSVEVEYTFDDYGPINSSVKLVFDKRNFIDGKAPVIKKLSFNPMGPNSGVNVQKNHVLRGDVYDIDAKLKPGDSVVVAIPLGFKYQAGRDSIVVEHYVEEENRWVAEPVDSIVGNFAYIKTGHFCWFIPVAIIVGAAVGCALWDDCREAVADGFRAAGRALKWVYDVVKAALCLDGDKFSKLFGSAKTSDWDPAQGSVSVFPLLEWGPDVLLDLINEQNYSPLVSLAGCAGSSEEEKCKWERTKKNLDILLADAISAQFNPIYAKNLDYILPNNVTSNPAYANTLGMTRYKFELVNNEGVITDAFNANAQYKYEDYFMTSSDFVENSARFIAGVKQCYGALNITGKCIQNTIDWYEGLASASWTKMCKAMFGFFETPFSWGGDIVKCAEFAIWGDKSPIDGHEGKLIAVSESMVRLSLLAWLKKADKFREFSLLKYKATYDGVRAWLELAGPFLGYNNIVTKAYGGLALYEYIHYGTDENLKMVNSGLNYHYGDNGGYSEGTGYSQYIWDDLTYVLAALKDAYKNQNESGKFNINAKFLKSPDYMFNFSRPVGSGSGNQYKHYGLIPVEVDDGVTYNPDYRVWAKLKNDPIYLYMGLMNPLKYEDGVRYEDGKRNALQAFGFEIPSSPYSPIDFKNRLNRGNLWGDFKDGIGMITAVNAQGDTVALSMIAEEGPLWMRGQGHDQQDNLSITLTSSKKGFLIQDPGYPGFDKRAIDDGFHNYVAHNVLTDDVGQRDNRTISVSEIKSKMNEFQLDFPGVLWSSFLNVLDLGIHITTLAGYDCVNYSYCMEGGNSAAVLPRMINEPLSGVVGYTATTAIASGFNHRSIMYFGGNFWVIDRPTPTGLKWHANSPKGSWNEMKNANVHLYASSKKDELDVSSKRQDIYQNGARGDYVNSSIVNYSYTAYEAGARTYVMNYALDNYTFEKTDSNCPQDYQCFVSEDGNMRVVVPPMGGKFNLCDILTSNECSGNVRSTGITMLAKTPLGEWTTHWVLDGDLSAVVNGTEVPIISATVTRTAYSYMLANGAVVSEKYKGPYLPAIPILLLR